MLINYVWVSGNLCCEWPGGFASTDIRHSHSRPEPDAEADVGPVTGSTEVNWKPRFRIGPWDQLLGQMTPEVAAIACTDFPPLDEVNDFINCKLPRLSDDQQQVVQAILTQPAAACRWEAVPGSGKTYCAAHLACALSARDPENRLWVFTAPTRALRNEIGEQLKIIFSENASTVLGQLEDGTDCAQLLQQQCCESAPRAGIAIQRMQKLSAESPTIMYV